MKVALCWNSSLERRSGPSSFDFSENMGVLFLGKAMKYLNTQFSEFHKLKFDTGFGYLWCNWETLHPLNRSHPWRCTVTLILRLYRRVSSFATTISTNKYRPHNLIQIRRTRQAQKQIDSNLLSSSFIVKVCRFAVTVCQSQTIYFSCKSRLWRFQNHKFFQAKKKKTFSWFG